ncbi:MAG: late competence development ComFB family protein [Treponema sp.]|nr:late competence development ComFB family protein [Treponema sp.]
MELYNTVKGKVISQVNEIFERLINGQNPNNFCTCNQCKMDVACYVLNRTPPHYIVSHRGASRDLIDGIEQQQHAADITTLVQEGLLRINENMRPHFHEHAEGEEAVDPSRPVFVVPTIVGRVLNGINFEPISDVDVELFRDKGLVRMKDDNWHNPCHLVANVEGNFSFWPAAAKAQGVDVQETFQYYIKISAPGFEPLTHFFKIPVKSEVPMPDSYALDRKFKLPDLYIFPPGEAEKSGYLD